VCQVGVRFCVGSAYLRNVNPRYEFHVVGKRINPTAVLKLSYVKLHVDDNVSSVLTPHNGINIYIINK
jgi:hypothetical protein